MPQRRVVIASAQGLHARPATVFTQAAAAVGHPVLIGRAGQDPVPADSPLMVMSLGLQQGDEVDLVVDDGAPAGTLDNLVALLETDLDAAS